MKKQTTRSEDARFVKDSISYSRLKTFSICPLLCYEQYIAKTYIEPEHDYFIYGHLVEDLLLEPDKIIERYARVDSRLKEEDALKYEVKIQNLEQELIPIKKKASAGNKVAIKGVVKRENEISVLKEKLKSIKKFEKLIQVTNALWDNAHETASKMMENPLFKTLQFTKHTIQQCLYDSKTERKAILDYIDFPKQAQEIYNLWQEKLITDEELYKQIAELPEEQKVARIIDIKTTARLKIIELDSWAGQLALYGEIIKAFMPVSVECFVLVGDKDSTRKQAQDILYKKRTLDEKLHDVLFVEKIYKEHKNANKWPSAKSLLGAEQTCFKCSECSKRPFSVDKPLVI